MRKKIFFTIRLFLFACLTAQIICPLRAWGAGAVYMAYREYEEHFAQIQTIADIRAQGYDVVEKHVFDVPLVSYYPDEADAVEEADTILPQPTEVVRPNSLYKIMSEDAVALQEVPTVRFYCALERKSHRGAVFLADEEGLIVYKTNRLECNYTVLGELNQPIYDMVSVAFQDLNGDELTDIILIAGCTRTSESGERKNDKIGEVLFQQDDSQDGAVMFYRDWRINDKINRYDMNQSAKSIRSFVRDGQSTEFLYTATTEQELLRNGFYVIEEQQYTRAYEKLGTLKILPGYFRQGDYNIFRIYMINEQGAIVWSFEPMGDYDNLYALKGISTVDLDGEGMKDLLVLGRYSREGKSCKPVISSFRSTSTICC